MRTLRAILYALYPMILIIDNYDSFVFNIARSFRELGEDVVMRRNNAINTAELAGLAPDAIILSPGPCSPNEAGASLDIIRAFSGKIPILGICLGHQCIGQAFGAVITRAAEPMHGIASAIHHDATGLFANLPNPFMAGRYHSLIVTACLPSTEIIARSDRGEIMALRHATHPTYGVQFHPESILTPDGETLLANFLTLTRKG